MSEVYQHWQLSETKHLIIHWSLTHESKTPSPLALLSLHDPDSITFATSGLRGLELAKISPAHENQYPWQVTFSYCLPCPDNWYTYNESVARTQSDQLLKRK
jgi:hypothetical protein